MVPFFRVASSGRIAQVRAGTALWRLRAEGKRASGSRLEPLGVSKTRRAVVPVPWKLNRVPELFPVWCIWRYEGVRSEDGSYLCLELFQAVESAFPRGEQVWQGRPSLGVTHRVSCEQALEPNACSPEVTAPLPLRFSRAEERLSAASPTAPGALRVCVSVTQMMG